MGSYAWTVRKRVTKVRCGDLIVEAYSVAFADQSGNWDYPLANSQMAASLRSSTMPARIASKKAAARQAAYAHGAFGRRFLIVCEDDRGIPADGDALYMILPGDQNKPWYHDADLEHLLYIGILGAVKEGRKKVLIAGVDDRKFRGVRTPDGCVVTLNGHGIPLRLDLANHSPTGFEWGYGGSGPSQLALSMLAEAVGPDRALELYQEFKTSFVSSRVTDTWELPVFKIQWWAATAEALRPRSES